MKTAIIIPTFNRPHLLQRAIDSAFNQTMKPHEVIVVNDGDPIEKIDSRVRFIKTDGYRGPSCARNIALSNLSIETESVCYLDDDDELLPNHIQDLTETLKTSDSKFAFSLAEYRYDNGLRTTDPEPNNVGEKKYYEPSALLQQNIAPVSSFVHYKQAAIDIGGWDETLMYMEDWDFWARMFLRHGLPSKTDKITNVIHKNSNQTNRTDHNIFCYSASCSWRDIVDDRLKYLAKNNRSLLQQEDLVKFHIPRLGIIFIVENKDDINGIIASMNSVSKQTNLDIEVLFVASEINEKIQEIAKTYSFIRPFLHPLSSYHAMVNFGLLVSRSEYIYMLKQGKTLESDMCKYLASLMLDRKSMAISVYRHGTLLMRRKVLDKIGGFKEKETDELFYSRVSKNVKICEEKMKNE